MHLCFLKILLTAPLCKMIPCLLQLILSSFYPHIFFSSLIPSFSFFARTKGFRIHLWPSNSLDVLFILIFISIVVYTEAVVLKNFANSTEKHLCWSETCSFTLFFLWESVNFVSGWLFLIFFIFETEMFFKLFLFPRLNLAIPQRRMSGWVQ